MAIVGVLAGIMFVAVLSFGAAWVARTARMERERAEFVRAFSTLRDQLVAIEHSMADTSGRMGVLLARAAQERERLQELAAHVEQRKGGRTVLPLRRPAPPSMN